MEVARLQKQLSGENSMIAERQTAVQEQLKDVQPLVDAAKRAVAQIKNDQIAEIRSLKSPPEAIYDVLEVWMLVCINVLDVPLQGVMRVLGQDDMSWNGMKKFLGQKTVKENIMAFDCAAITPQIRYAVATTTDNNVKK